jgi:hypothetical protein
MAARAFQHPDAATKPVVGDTEAVMVGEEARPTPDVPIDPGMTAERKKEIEAALGRSMAATHLKEDRLDILFTHARPAGITREELCEYLELFIEEEAERRRAAVERDVTLQQARLQKMCEHLSMSNGKAAA